VSLTLPTMRCPNTCANYNRGEAGGGQFFRSQNES
jgi:hypothetical protein